jgi:hypothetical protein
MQSGLWDALEELRLAKNDLEEKLKVAATREDNLRAQLQELREASALRMQTSIATEAAVPAQESRKDIEEVDCSSVDARVQSENAALRRNLHLLEERLDAAMSWSETGPSSPPEKSAAEEVDLSAVQETHRCETETLKKEHAELQESLRSENATLKKERKMLQERLEIFERALELESPRKESLGTDCDGMPSKSKLGEKLEQLHSQFVLEVVGLRKEVAGLKKKKWVLRSVLANGGESERKAIENEVAELRRTTGAFDLKARGDKCEKIPLEIDANMVTTK